MKHLYEQGKARCELCAHFVHDDKLNGDEGTCFAPNKLLWRWHPSGNPEESRPTVNHYDFCMDFFQKEAEQ
jgi:hypothetical protein